MHFIAERCLSSNVDWSVAKMKKTCAETLCKATLNSLDFFSRDDFFEFSARSLHTRRFQFRKKNDMKHDCPLQWYS